MYDVIIIGAGASGCFCALNLKYNNPNLKILLLEKNNKIGKKLLITGNGRCNLGNINNDLSNYNSNSSLERFKNILEIDNYDFLNVLDNTDDNENYFEILNKFGILTRKEEDRIYPYSMQALSVCKSFERALEYYNVNIKYDYDVLKIVKNDDLFIINDELKSKKVVIATGGKTYHKTGSTGSGYEILKRFGHGITDLYPSLTSLKTNYKYIKDLAGVRAEAIVSLSVDGWITESEEGQVQFTKDSLSGISIFNLSRNVAKYLKEQKNVKIIINLVSQYSELELENYLKSFSGYTSEDALSCIINNKLAIAVAKELKVYGKKIKMLSQNELEALSFNLHNMYFDIENTGDFEMAQVTSGGANLEEFTDNLESKKCKGLYATGEILDVDGKCGGYNLSWAFNSALIVSYGILNK